MEQYTKYELARLVGARALQIAMGAPVLVKVPSELVDSIDIARYEVEMGAAPITVLRPKPKRVEQ